MAQNHLFNSLYTSQDLYNWPRVPKIFDYYDIDINDFP